MNENEFVWYEKRYVAVGSTGKCDGCAFKGDKSKCQAAPPCTPMRFDGRNVIFVEAPKPKTNGDRIRGMSNEELAKFIADWLNSPVEEEREGK